jgi:predicted phage baseplate assembly protein
LRAALVIDERRVPVRIVSDSTAAFLATGVILLDLSDVKSSPAKFTLELRSPGGFARPPRVLRIEPNIIPIKQGRNVDDESYNSNGAPDLRFKLQSPGLQFRSGDDPVVVNVLEPSGKKTWSRTDRLITRGPDENVYEFDTAAGEIVFGNGINGRIPPPDSTIAVTYSVSNGAQGNVARGRKWHVSGFEGAFGINPDPVAGGMAAPGWDEQRREARRRTREDHALVSSEDIETAAKELKLLEVARAWVAPPDSSAPRTGVITLVALRSRPGGNEPERSPETASWLQAIRRNLAPRMLLGTRLEVTSPRYRDFTIHAEVEIDAGRKPAEVEAEIHDQLGRRLALVESAKGITPRQPGIPVTVRDVGAWILATGVVTRVVNVELRDADGKVTTKIKVPGNGLPRWIAGDSKIDVRRPEKGRSG